MNNDDIYVEMKCDACGKFDYNIKLCSQCHKKYCRSVVCSENIVNIRKNLICKGGCAPLTPALKSKHV